MLRKLTRGRGGGGRRGGRNRRVQVVTWTQFLNRRWKQQDCGGGCGGGGSGGRKCGSGGGWRRRGSGKVGRCRVGGGPMGIKDIEHLVEVVARRVQDTPHDVDVQGVNLPLRVRREVLKHVEHVLAQGAVRLAANQQPAVEVRLEEVQLRHRVGGCSACGGKAHGGTWSATE